VAAPRAWEIVCALSGGLRRLEGSLARSKNKQKRKRHQHNLRKKRRAARKKAAAQSD
jgi:hypothetical protein